MPESASGGRLRQLVDLIDEEDDLDKFTALVAELNQLLDERKPQATRPCIKSRKPQALSPSAQENRSRGVKIRALIMGRTISDCCGLHFVRILI
jgi:hypothetical protein